MPERLILASSSPRRRELLTNAGIEFEVHTANIPEIRQAGEAAVDYCRRLAREKAQAVAAGFPGRRVLGADTIVMVGDELLEKPKDVADAIRMLLLLRGKPHNVVTAVCLISASRIDVRHQTTLVHFRNVSEEELRAYVATGEPMDKAGAYAIQGIASRWIDRIEGDYFNVVGLPVALVCQMFQDAADAR